jgi:hypothetical protein
LNRDEEPFVVFVFTIEEPDRLFVTLADDSDNATKTELTALTAETTPRARGT